ncbi:TetR/AcrR family transcriptional regulator C-terminal domain-containing protein [Klugiella xanthotipulae]|uniref:TetR family transcriptional regulator n=1 Tax=Klugiella xanthotipulae TaxID=244735 RepID=A0A543I667_9MICO|nr:TetR/AcrR family transcriptional regulator C-terminal domain-containing protein [Klugiella xanthotipulae]TQM66092.1 TetR family transcriptional regulator [Klugiella xanthotipulae]
MNATPNPPKKRKTGAPRPSPTLSRAAIVAASIAVADTRGLTGLSMRKVGEELGVEAMSLYNHVTHKEDLLDGMIDVIFAEIDLPSPSDNWQAAMRTRALSTLEALERHPWAAPLMESRATPGAATLTHHNTVLGILRTNGFSVRLAAHAFSALDSYIYGFALQNVNLPFDALSDIQQATEMIVNRMPADTYPHLAELASTVVMQPGYSYRDEFAWGLDLLIEALEHTRRATDDPTPEPPAAAP